MFSIFFSLFSIRSRIPRKFFLRAVPPCELLFKAPVFPKTLIFPVSGYRPRIILEVSLRRKNAVKGEPALIAGDFLPPYTITMLPQKMLVEEKLAAVLSRSKPRDYFDLYFLLRKGLVAVEQKKILGRIKRRLEQERLSLEKELRDFLPKNQQKLIRDLQAILLREISRHA